MSRRLCAVVSITGLGSLACGGVIDGLSDRIGMEVVPRTPMPSDLVPHTEPLPEGEPDGWGSGSLNARHPEHGTIYVTRGDPAYCYVHVPFEGDPGSWEPPDTERVDCPESMFDAAWLECPGGTIGTKVSEDGGQDCVCSWDGNPPPPPAWVHCPADASG